MGRTNQSLIGYIHIIFSKFFIKFSISFEILQFFKNTYTYIQKIKKQKQKILR